MIEEVCHLDEKRSLSSLLVNLVRKQSYLFQNELTMLHAVL